NPGSVARLCCPWAETLALRRVTQGTYADTEVPLSLQPQKLSRSRLVDDCMRELLALDRRENQRARHRVHVSPIEPTVDRSWPPGIRCEPVAGYAAPAPVRSAPQFLASHLQSPPPVVAAGPQDGSSLHQAVRAQARRCLPHSQTRFFPYR